MKKNVEKYSKYSIVNKHVLKTPHKYLYNILLRKSPYTLKSLLAKVSMIIKSFSIVFFPENTRFDILKMCGLLNEKSDIYY